MKEFLQSDFLQALSQSLIASIWQMALLWLATITLFKLFRLSSSQKFHIAFVAQISGFSVFVYNCIHIYNSGTSIIANETSEKFLLNINAVITALMLYIAIIYLGIVLFKLIRLAFTYKHTKSLKSYDLKKISADKRIFVQEMSQLFSLKKKVSIYLSGKIVCPLTIGFLKPVILIPFAAINQLTTEQMEAVILHELAHIKRADYLLFILQSVVEKFFFFNIFSSMLSEIIERERENSCDDWVLQFRYNSQHYAEALFKLGRLKALPVLSMQFTGKKESVLLTRIKRLLHNSNNKISYNFQSVLFSFLSLLFVAVLLVLIETKPVKQKITAIAQKSTESQKIKSNTEADKSSVSLKPTEVAKAKNTVKESNINSEKVAFEKGQSIYRINEAQENIPEPKQNYLFDVKQQSDTVNSSLSQVKAALNSQVVITPDVLRKAISYQNFKQLENMLAASGDSINITETDASKDSYQKEITITAKDKNGNKHIYTVVVQLYQ
ncbi:MAG: M56 family metallopeptidase [Parafilimonas sp.]